jgi:hypothetical protein
MPIDPSRRPRPKGESSKVFTVETLHQLSSSPFSKFLIVMANEGNSFVDKFKAWFEINQAKLTFPVYMVNVTADPALTQSLLRLYNVTGFPTFVVTDPSMRQIDTLVGFNQVAAVSFFKKNFPENTTELH